jgi:P27 family predicted phage terminase small subunit
LSRPAQLPHVLELKGRKPRTSRAAGVPGFAAGRPATPKTLSAEARAEWKRLVRELLARGTLTKPDATILELHCETYARWLACKAEIDGKFFVDIPVTDSNGQIVYKRGPNPACAMLEKCEAILRQTLVQLGATPNSRAIKQMTTEGRKRNEPAIPGSVGALLEAEER